MKKKLITLVCSIAIGLVSLAAMLLLTSCVEEDSRCPSGYVFSTSTTVTTDQAGFCSRHCGSRSSRVASGGGCCCRRQ